MIHCLCRSHKHKKKANKLSNSLIPKPLIKHKSKWGRLPTSNSPYNTSFFILDLFYICRSIDILSSKQVSFPRIVSKNVRHGLPRFGRKFVPRGHRRWHKGHQYSQKSLRLSMAKTLHHIHQPFRLRNHSSSDDLREAAIQSPCCFYDRTRRFLRVPAKVRQDPHREKRHQRSQHRRRQKQISFYRS